PGRPLLLLLLVTIPCPGQPGGPCPLPCRCHQGLLDCSHAALARVPPATRRRALLVLNLGGNLITQIRNGTFQAWHGMQFLQKLILSQNPLSIIADTSFFKLPSVKYLDLGATQVTKQTLLTLLLTTIRLETLKLPSEMFCCLCQEKPTTGTPCRTINFQCESLCSTGAPQCAHTDPLAEAQGAIMEVPRYRKLTASTVLNLKLKEASLRDHKTITLAVVLSLTGTDADLSNLNNHISRPNPRSPQHLSRQGGKNSEELVLHMGCTGETDRRKLYILVKALVAELKKQLHQPKSVGSVKSTISTLPAPAVLMDEVEEDRSTGRLRKRRGLNLNPAALKPWEAVGRFNPADNVSISRHGKISTPPKRFPSRSSAAAPRLPRPFKIRDYLDTVEQTKKHPPSGELGGAEDAEEAPSPRQDDVWTYRKHKQEDSKYLNQSKLLFSKPFRNVNLEEEPTPIESKAEQGLNTNQRVFDNLLVNKNPHTASSRLEDAAEEEGSSVKGHLPAAPRTTETRQKQQNKGSSFPNNPGSSASPDDALVQGDLFEAKVNHHLRWLITDEALRVFIARMEALRAFITRMVRALGMDCSVPKLQPACAKLLDKLELLVKLLSERQDKQEASGLAGQCLREGNVSSGMGRAEYMGRKTSGKKAQYTSSDRLLLAIAVSVTIVINLLLMCLVEVYSSRHSAASHPQSAGKSRPKCFFQKLLPWGWGKNKEDVREQGSPVSDPSQTKPQWLRDLYLPLDPQQLKSIAELYDGDISDEEEMFNKFELNWMPTAPRKSCDPREMPLPADLIPRPSASSAHQELQIWSHFTAEDAPGGHAVRVPQNSPWRDGEPL
ncbi:putative LOC102084175, partial [Columba livia]